MESFICQICHQHLDSPDLLDVHIAVEHPVKEEKSGKPEPVRRFQCEVCSRRFAGRTALKDHRWKVHDKFDGLTSANEVEGVTRERQYHVCDYCGKIYSWKHKLKIHVTRVHGIPITFNRNRESKRGRNFVCEHCAEAFTSNQSLTRHMMNVHGVKSWEPRKNNFVCLLCEKHYRTKRQLSVHMQEAHDVAMEWRKYTPRELGQFQCKLCDKRLSSVYGLSDHMAVMHGEVPTPKRKKKQLSKETIEASTGVYQCSECGLRVAEVYKFKRHMMCRHMKTLEDAEAIIKAVTLQD